MTVTEYIPPLVRVITFRPTTHICVTSSGEDVRGTEIPGFIEEEW